MNTRTISIIFLSIMILSIMAPLTNIVASAAISVSVSTTNTVYKFYKNQEFFFYLNYNVSVANVTVFINDEEVVTFTNVPPIVKVNFTVNSSGYLLVNSTTYGTSPLTVGNVYKIVFRISSSSAGSVNTSAYYYTYTPTDGVLELDRKHYPAFDGTVIHMILKDWDKNWNPFEPDSHNVTLTVKAYFLNGTEKEGTITLTFVEMGNNTSRFYSNTTLGDLVGSIPNLTVDPAVLNEISCFEVIYTDEESGSTSSWIFDVFYTLGTIEVTKPSFPDELEITVKDPDANLDSWAYDAPLPHSIIEVYVKYEDPETKAIRIIDFEQAEEELSETGENTSTFTHVFPVTFNTSYEPNNTENIYNDAVRPLNDRTFSFNDGHLLIVPGSWLEIKYYDYDPAKGGLELVATKTVYPVFYNTSLVVTYNGVNYTTDFNAPTPKGFTFNIAFNDTNLEDKQWDIVKDGPCPACPCYDWKLYAGEKAEIPVYSGYGTPYARLVGKIEILVNGKPVNMTKNVTVSICRVTNGQFKVTFKDEYLRIVPFNILWLNPMPNYGDTLTIKWVDYIAGKSSSITVTFPPAEISLTLDRKEYPILHSSEKGDHKVVVHITVKDTTRLLENTTTAKVEVLPGAPSDCNYTKPLYINNSVYLSKSDEVVFTGEVKIPVNETFLNAVLVVEYTAGDGTLVKATAVFKPHDGKIQIKNSAASVNDKITIELVEPDRNLDSEANDTVKVNLNVYVNDIIIRTKEVTLHETGPNTSVFTSEVWLDDSIVYWINTSRAPLVVTIVDKLSVNYVDGITSKARWVPGARICGPSGCKLCSVDPVPYASGDSVKVMHHDAELYIFKVDPTNGDITSNSSNVSIDISQNGKVLPVDRIRIFLVDPDLVFLGKWQTSNNTTRSTAANNTLIVSVKATKDREERYLLETSYVKYNPRAKSWVIPPRFFNKTDVFVSPLINIGPLGCCEIAARTCFVEVTGSGDKILIKYIDTSPEEGTKKPIDRTLTVVAEFPTIKIWFTDEKGNSIRNITVRPEDVINSNAVLTNKTYITTRGQLPGGIGIQEVVVMYKIDEPVVVEPGYYISVKVCDDDALALYDVVRSDIWGLLNPYVGYEPTLSLYTTTDTTGITKKVAEILKETAPRYFMLENYKLDNVSMIFKKQDKLYIVFSDAFAYIDRTGLSKQAADKLLNVPTSLLLYKFVIEIPLGARPPAYPVVPNETGVEFKEVQVVPGTTSYVLDVPIFINGTATIPQLTVIAVIMKDGSVYDIRWTTYYNLAPGATTVSADLGTSLEPGNYTVKILFWESLTSMKPLSEKVVEYSFTFTE